MLSKTYMAVITATIVCAGDSVMQGNLYAANPTRQYLTIASQKTLAEPPATWVSESLIATPDGRHVAFAVAKGSRWTVVHDGSEAPGSRIGRIRPLTLSRDGHAVAYTVFGKQGDVEVTPYTGPKTHSKRDIVIQRRDGCTVDEVNQTIVDGSVTLSDDGKKYAYVATVGDKSELFINDHKQDGFQDVQTEAPIFRYDRNAWSFAAKKNGYWCLAAASGHKSELGKPYDAVRNPILSMDGRHLAYIGDVGQSSCMVIDNHERYKHGGRILAFSCNTDASHVAYILSESRDSERMTILQDGREIEAGVPSAHTIQLSPDGERIAFVTKRGAEWVVIDQSKRGRIEHGSYPKVSNLAFSKDSKRIAYVVPNGRHQTLIVDDVVWDDPNVLDIGQPIFDGPARVRVLTYSLHKGRMICLTDLRTANLPEQARDGLVFPSHDAARSYAAGIAFLKDGNLKKGLESLSAAVQLDTRYVDAYLARADAYHRIYEPFLAERDVYSATTISPSNTDCRRARVAHYLFVGSFEKALNECARILEAEPRDATAYAIQGAILTGTGNAQRGARDLKRSLEIAEQMGPSDCADLTDGLLACALLWARDARSFNERADKLKQSSCLWLASYEMAKHAMRLSLYGYGRGKNRHDAVYSTMVNLIQFFDQRGDPDFRWGDPPINVWSVDLTFAVNCGDSTSDAEGLMRGVGLLHSNSSIALSSTAMTPKLREMCLEAKIDCLLDAASKLEKEARHISGPTPLTGERWTSKMADEASRAVALKGRMNTEANRLVQRASDLASLVLPGNAEIDGHFAKRGFRRPNNGKSPGEPASDRDPPAVLNEDIASIPAKPWHVFGAAIAEARKLDRREATPTSVEPLPMEPLPRRPFGLWRNSTGMSFILIPSGTFEMGVDVFGVRAPVIVSGDADKSRAKPSLGERLFLGVLDLGLRATHPLPAPDDQKPKHTVLVSRPFFVARYETTQEEFRDVMGENPSFFCEHGKGAANVEGFSTQRFPVEGVTWFDALRYCNRLSVREGRKPYYEIRKEGHDELATIIGGDGYRLLTEAEWEYVRRAGQQNVDHFEWDVTDADLSNLVTQANIRIAVGELGYNRGIGATTEVGSYLSNDWGVYDMCGNVWEWVQDGYDAGAYHGGDGKTTTDPCGDICAVERVIRGASWESPRNMWRKSYRGHETPSKRSSQIGFRVALNAPHR